MGQGGSSKPNFDDDVNLNHFRLLRVVGRGAFGKVRIVERKDTGLTFALKYIRKSEVVHSESVRNILRERRMLEHLNYQFICNLRYSFQDIEYMYMVIDLMSGGDLRFHISRKTFTEEAVRFWIAELALGLRYIHQQGIVHRDIKPDNVLLDSEGHVHLADFNVASDFSPNKPLTSKSGTLAYLAPEVYKGKGYSCGADWWSLGVLFYECIYNKRPFDGSTQSVLAAQITRAAPKYPVTNPPVSMPCLHAISSALEEDPTKRIGSASWLSFIDNPFFRDIDFEALERKEIEPVFVPNAEKTNFDATYDLEELLLEEAPLEARARRQKPRDELRADASEKEIREDELYKMIEREFTNFDYTTKAYERRGRLRYVNGEQPDAIPEEREGARPTGDGQRSSSRRRKSKSAASTPTGSPPMPGRSPNVPQMPQGQTRSAPSAQQQQTLNPYPSSYSNRSQKSSGTRKESLGGGMQVTLGAEGSWSELAKHDTTLPADAKLEEANKPTGMLSFLGRKKGRGHSPKPQERGILGKEGFRVVISNGD